MKEENKMTLTPLSLTHLWHIYLFNDNDILYSRFLEYKA